MDIQISFRSLTFLTVLLPFLAFITCIYLSLINNFKGSTSTHCGVSNYLPSISSAIGDFFPQRHIWRLAIALHSSPRFLVAYMYYNFIKRNIPNIYAYQVLTKINSAFNVIENLCLLGLSFVSSGEHYGVHKTFFIGFMLFSELYMILTCLLLKERTFQIKMSYDVKAYRYKKRCVAVNITCYLMALYFFYRHNKYCEPGVSGIGLVLTCPTPPRRSVKCYTKC